MIISLSLMWPRGITCRSPLFCVENSKSLDNQVRALRRVCFCLDGAFSLVAACVILLVNL